jgi:hypothetical protein
MSALPDLTLPGSVAAGAAQLDALDTDYFAAATAGNKFRHWHPAIFSSWIVAFGAVKRVHLET